jgi:proteasome alpha subunit
MQFYAPTEQIMRDRSEYARKGISRGRSVVVLTYADGVLFVAENPSTALHKVSEIYDRIGFAAVGRYNEFENLRNAGVRMADLRGYAYDRRDVTARALANAYAQTLGAIFTETGKPFEVEICVAQVGATPDADELYRLSFDGSVGDEPGYVAMGGQPDGINTVLKADHRRDAALGEALTLAVRGLASVGGDGTSPRQISASQLEVAVLDRRRTGRTFRRITGIALTTLLEAGAGPAAEAAAEATEEPAPPTIPPATLTHQREPAADKPTPKPKTPRTNGKPEAKPTPETGPAAETKPTPKPGSEPGGTAEPEGTGEPSA